MFAVYVFMFGMVMSDDRFIDCDILRVHYIMTLKSSDTVELLYL